nr:Ig-like domain-containing protein [Plesiomonas shigelloides]
MEKLIVGIWGLYCLVGVFLLFHPNSWAETIERPVFSWAVRSDASILDGSFSVIKNNAEADGVAENEVQVKVTTPDGQPIEGAPVIYFASNGATIIPHINPTGKDGISTASVTNFNSGMTTVEASLTNGASAKIEVLFNEGVDDKGINNYR